MNLQSLTRTRALSLALAALALLVAAPSVRAQEEGVPVVVDEVIAQVNNDVVTLSMVKREMNDAVEALVRDKLGDPDKHSAEMVAKTRREAIEEAEKNKANIIASLINEQLLMQKGKDIPRLTEDVEAEVNRTMLAEASRQGIKTIEVLEEAMIKAGLVPSEIRQRLRTQITRQAVLQREVDSKIYFSITDAELQKYFAEHREKFRKPESVELSEIFLSLAGKSEAEVRAKAAQLVAQARGGADFGQLASLHSEREFDGVRVAPQNKGKVGRFETVNLRAELSAAIKNVAKGGVTDPVRLDEGYQILRVDDRTGSPEPVFNEQQVRGAITEERANKERQEYLNTLRKEAYIDIASSYRASVLPLLKIDLTSPTSKEEPTTPKPATGKKTN